MRRRVPFFRTVLILGVTLVAAGTGLLVLVRVDRVVAAPGQLRGAMTVVRAPWSGVVRRVSVQADQQVQAGQALLELDTTSLVADQAQIEARLDRLQTRAESLEQEREHLTSRLHPGQRAEIERGVERARLELERARTRAEALAQLRGSGLVSRLELEEAELGQELAAVDLRQAVEQGPLQHSRHQAELARLGSELESISSQQLEERARLGEIEQRLATAVVVARRDGVVVAQGLDQSAGRAVTQGEELMRLGGGSVDRFECRLDDHGRAVVRVGLSVRVRLDGYPWLVHGAMSGTVGSITEGPDRDGRFPVRIEIDQSTAPGEIFEGMKGEARIVRAERVLLGRLLLERLTRADGS